MEILNKSRIFFSEASKESGSDSARDPVETAQRLARLRHIRRLAWLLDGAFRLPGTNFRFGLNAPIGLAPGVGDAVLTALSFYIVYEAVRLGMPKAKIITMVGNIAIETILGTVPVLGDLLDVGWKANLRNLAIVERHFS